MLSSNIISLSNVKLARQQLYNLLATRIDAKGKAWLDGKIEQLVREYSERDFYLTFNLIPRFSGKKPLKPDTDELQRLEALRNGLDLSNWTVDQVGRNLILLYIPFDDLEFYHITLKNLFETAGVDELVALYAGLPLSPLGEELKDRAAEGIRTNMTAVFDAMALNNPYPKDYFGDEAWNQMILKAFFMERPIYRILGVEDRHNEKLAHMISDYAHERWAANRITMPEMWRAIGTFVNDTLLADLRRMLEDPDKLQQQAAALACYNSGSERARTLLLNQSDLKNNIENNTINWQEIGIEWEKRQYEKKTLYE